ncbi:MAG TPA: MFS transporter [Trebonia sp.]|nr:MFS transporter [Trebonia sp.]
MVTLLREPARPAFVREHRLAPWLAVGTVCFGAFMGQLDASIVTVAFPSLQHQFHSHLAAVQWVSLAYLLALTALLVPVGRWSDRVGRKLFYLYGFVVFAAASAACGLAPSLGILIALRVVQAGGAAMLQANSVALVVTSVPAAKRRAALGIQAAAQAVGLASGPVTGGLLVASAGWRWVFFLNVPVGVIAVAAGIYLLPRTRGVADGGAPDPDPDPDAAGRCRADPGQAGRQQTDLAGMALLTIATTAGMLAISTLSGLRWPAWAVAGCGLGAAVAAVALWGHEHRTAAPLLDFRALRTSGAGRALGGALCSYLVLFGPLVLIPQAVTARGGSALQAGLLLTALPAGFGLAAAVADRILGPRWTNQVRCLAGAVLAAGCAAALAAFEWDPAAAGFEAACVVLLGLLGAGLGLYTPANNAEIMAVLPARDAATAGGMVNMTRGIGTALGVAAVTLGLNVAKLTGHASIGPALSMGVLAGAGVLAAVAGAGATGTRQ